MCAEASLVDNFWRRNSSSFMMVGVFDAHQFQLWINLSYQQGKKTDNQIKNRKEHVKECSPLRKPHTIRVVVTMIMIYEIHTLVSRREKFWTQFFSAVHPVKSTCFHILLHSSLLCRGCVFVFTLQNSSYVISCFFHATQKNLISKRNNFKMALDTPARFSRELFRSFSTLWWGKTGNVLINKISFPAGRQRAAEVDNIGCDGWMAGMFEKTVASRLPKRVIMVNAATGSRKERR